MGEVIEVSIISHDDDIAKKVMCFMEDLFEIKNGIQNIEVMDNWNYENTFYLNSLVEAKKYMRSKIITYTENSLGKQIGVSIEHFTDYYQYDFWYNPRLELSANEYKNIYGQFVNYFQKELKDGILIAGIGREIFIDFDLNIDDIIKKSYNIDIWIIKKDIYEKCRLKGIEKTDIVLI